MNISLRSTALAIGVVLLSASTFAVNDEVIVATDAYCWKGDTIYQDSFKAWSPDGLSLISTYSAAPGYYMPIEKEWHLSKDISSYPSLSTPNKLHEAIYRLGLEEMINAVEPDTTLRTGKEWAGVWTRDVSYSILLSMAYMQPEAARISLMKKVTPDGRIIQDTGSGGAWPVSSDRLIWALAAFEVYKVTGDRAWLEYIYPVIARSVESDEQVTRSPRGLALGETSFIDWREQSYPRWMQTADIYASEALSTSVVHAQTYKVLAEIATILGDKKQAAEYEKMSNDLAGAINDELWMSDKGYYAMYTYGPTFPIVNPRAETLGESLAILYDIAPADRAAAITENNPTTPFGAAIFFPQIADMPPYHNNSLWPWVASYWALANAKTGNEQGLLEAIGSVFRPAALFTTNKENFVLDNGDIATELNSSNMLWCLAGNLAITQRILFGITFATDRLEFHPVVPRALAATRSLDGFSYRDAILNITVSGYGNRIKSFTLNGKEHAPWLPADIKGTNDIVITMADNDFDPMTVAHSKNLKAPLTPIATLSNSPELNGEGVPVNNLLQWAPIEYIDHYVVLRNGKRIATTRRTSYEATTPGQYQVIGVSGNGTESFASMPVDNFTATVVEMPAEATAMISPEVSYAPATAVEGWHGGGFRELDHSTLPLEMQFTAPHEGDYAISFVYANGNGPVNTENKCAVRTLTVNGQKAGTIVMPHRGVANWNDWGSTNTIIAHLPEGTHTIALEFHPYDENMNMTTNHALVDRMIVKEIVQ